MNWLTWNTVLTIINAVWWGMADGEKISYLPRPKANVDKAINYKSFREQELIRSLLYNYQSTLRPPGAVKHSTNVSDDEPVHVYASIHILSLSSFNDVTMTFTCQFRLRQEWVDLRLAFDDSYFRPDEFLILAKDQDVWQPDTFFQNEQSGHEHIIDQENVYLKIRSDGRVKYSKRLTMDFSCPMNLLLFPHDTQTCYIDFASYAYTSSDILYVWDNPAIEQLESAIDAMPKFSIEGLENASCTTTTATGTYSCLRVILQLRREVSFFLLQLYLPSCMMVAVGCVSFWIDWRSAPARVPLAIVTLLTITTQAHGINSNLPPVSYTKAIDVWIGACVVFIFGALLEFAVVNYVGTNEEKRRAKRRDYAYEKDYAAIKPLITPIYTQCNGVAPEISADQRRHPRRRRAKSRPKSNVTVPLTTKEALLDEEDARGDCFDAEEYVSYRRKMARHRRRSGRSLMINMIPGSESPGSENNNIAIFAADGSLSISSNASRAERIDMVSRIVFPIGFLLFNVVYWALYIPLMR